MKEKQLFIEMGLSWGTGGWNQEWQSRKALWRPPSPVKTSKEGPVCMGGCGENPVYLRSFRCGNGLLAHI